MENPKTDYAEKIRKMNKTAFLKYFTRAFPKRKDGESEFLRIQEINKQEKEKESVKA
jgi:hypothetical protein